MKIRMYLLTLVMSVATLLVTPAWAQDELADEAAAETEVPADDEEESGKSRKKKKKGKKKSAGGESRKNAKADGEAETGMPAVPAALSKFKQLNGKPNLKAEYFVYLYSASWCGHCQACMPVAVDVYKKMKSSRKVEMVIIGGDNSEKAAKDYLKSKKAKMPGIWFEALKAKNFQNLPGCGIPGFPAAVIVDKDGNTITSAIGAGNVKELLSNWRGHTIGGR